MSKNDGDFPDRYQTIQQKNNDELYKILMQHAKPKPNSKPKPKPKTFHQFTVGEMDGGAKKRKTVKKTVGSKAHRCSAKTKDGKRCKSLIVKGKKCHRH